jgi:hypothetical protein
MSNASQPERCPACGQNNQCTLANPLTATTACWCFSVTIDPERLAALPAAERNISCLCPRCAGQTPNPATT